MAKESKGKDKAFYETGSGFTHAVAGMSNDITGTPPSPGLRGNTKGVGDDLLPNTSNNHRNSVVDSFYMEKGK